MFIIRKHGSTSNVIRAMLRNSSTGAGLTGLSSASSGLVISTIADIEASATTYTVGSSNVETISTLGTFAAPTSGKCRFKEVDSTNHPGLYEFQFADARFSVSNAKVLRISVSGAASLLNRDITIQLSKFDPDDAVRGGLTALPNANAEASGGLYTRGSGAGQISQQANGQIDVNLERLKNDAQSATDAKDLFDTGYDPATHKLEGVKTADALTANNDKTGYALTSAYDAAKTAASPSDVAAELETYDAPTKAEFDAAVALLATAATLALVKAQTDLIPATPASTGDAMALTTSERAALADKFLGRTRAGGGDGGRTVAQALAPLRNKVAITAINESAGTATMTVYDDDDTTPLYAYAVSLTTLAKSMTALDPAS